MNVKILQYSTSFAPGRLRKDVFSAKIPASDIYADYKRMNIRPIRPYGSCSKVK